MHFPIIKVPSGCKICVVGDIHEHQEQFENVLRKVNPSSKSIFVSVGDIYDKGSGPKTAEAIIDTLKPFINNGFAYVIRGNHELSNIRRARQENALTPHLEWIEKQPLALTFQFVNGTFLTVVHGGVLPSYSWEEIFSNIEVCYVRNICEEGKLIKKVWENGILVPEKSGGFPWHKVYDGRFGYIASGHDAQRDGIPKFYNFSCNLDTMVYKTGTLTAQFFGENGREELIMVNGSILD